MFGVACSPLANPSGASGTECAARPLRILIVQAQRVWNPQVFWRTNTRPLA
ncbi:hypothetical protein HMPREF0908_1600 [Selenomonas flueggei ATCC 43531]|uniref:Uncharacterized protein n=1 Tax=Selenomonas flueggei ATCC 43531 TaxID=638302 RepID=C4V506_9FIRM|nr:hypothetical protein HMPREF0908_1600 [Selenomonas flueggei ATCC 43531]